MGSPSLRRLLAAALLAAGGLSAGLVHAADTAVRSNGLMTAVVRSESGATQRTTDGVVEAVRQSVLAAQVAGTVTWLKVLPGDRIQAGQALIRLDVRTANSQAQASRAQVAAAEAQLVLARKELDRQRQLAAQQFISQGALDQAEARFRATEAETKAMMAQAQAAGTQTDLHTIVAPYNGLVAAVPVALGDMALPGRALVSVYDPSAMRIALQVPQELAARLRVSPQRPITVTVDGQAAALTLGQAVVLPAVDPVTHTVTVHLPLPAGAGDGVARPGSFVRADLGRALEGDVPAVAGSTGAAGRLTVPASAVMRRGELNAVYVVDAQGRVRMRQVRLGAVSAGSQQVEILAGVAAGEQVAVDPLAALRVVSGGAAQAAAGVR